MSGIEELRRLVYVERNELLLKHKQDSEHIRQMREALELIAAPMRPDGTYNRDREACRQLALQVLEGTK